MKYVVLLILLCLLVLSKDTSIAQNLSWSSTQGPFAITVNAFDTLNGSIFAGSNNGLYKSTNEGTSWTAVSSVSGIIYDIILGGKKLYAAGGGGLTKIFLSTDSGATWAARDSGLPQFTLVYSLIDVNDTLYACLGSDGLYRSTDGGKFWASPNADIRDKSISAMIATKTSLILAEGSGVLRSTNGGFSWEEPNGVISGQTIHCFVIKDTVIFAGTESGLFRSTDDGSNWESFGTGISSNDNISSLLVSSDRKTIFAGTKDILNDAGIYRSIDDGNSWQQVNTGLSSLSINALFSIGTEIFTGTDLYISRSTNNGDLWQTASQGLPKPMVTSLGSIYNIVFAGTEGSFIFSSDDAGDHWSQHKKGLTHKNVNAFLTDGTTVFAGTDGSPKQGLGGLHQSNDNGNTWSQTTSGLPVMTISQLVSYNSEIILSSDSGIYSSADNGSSWKRFSNLIPKTIYSNDTGFYVADTAGSPWVYTSNAGWAPVSFPQQLKIKAIVKAGSSLYFGTDSGIYRNSASNWSLVTGDSLNVQCLWWNNFILVAGTKKGVYISFDGSSWQLQQSTATMDINALWPNEKKFLYAGTDSGVIKASLIGFGVTQAPKQNVLSLEVTNPSAANANIRYSIDQRNPSSLLIYDLLGRETARIFSEEKEAGKYTVEWNTSMVPNGSYIIRLISGPSERTTMVNVVH